MDCILYMYKLFPGSWWTVYYTCINYSQVVGGLCIIHVQILPGWLADEATLYKLAYFDWLLHRILTFGFPTAARLKGRMT